MEPVPIAEPFTAAELARDLAAVRVWSARFWERFTVEQFFLPVGQAWSPADNVRHLVKSNRPVAVALGVPKPMLALRFGLTWRASRHYSELVATYHAALAGGLKAGRYTASPVPSERRTDEQRRESLGALDETLAALVRLLGRWGERALDRLRLPHPGLGMLTVREMAMFTLYHNTHHALGVARRLDAAEQVPAGAAAP
jgi:hypothetical protein